MSGSHLVAGDYRWGKNPLRSFPSDLSLGKTFPNDLSLRKGSNVRQGKSSLGIIAGDCIPDEYSPATIPQRHVAEDRFPQRHVAGKNPKMLLGKTPIVVV
ncbi:hypothetical protein Tco_1417093 [Tanacetum coccineum]